jgi:carboxyl-terminal processing protease
MVAKFFYQITQKKHIVFSLLLIIAVTLYAISRNNGIIRRDAGILTQVYTKILTSHADEIDSDELLYSALRGMTEGLDPYTVFLKKEDKFSIRLLTKGEYGGVGIRLGKRNDTLTVVSTMEGGPAYRSGVLSGDRIVAIDGMVTEGMSLDDAANKIRGKKGTKVTLTIRRLGYKRNIDFPLTREIIHLDEIPYSGFIEDKIGYIRFSGFSGNSVDSLEVELRRLINKGMTALILDLRGNPGGLLTEALKVADLFIPRKKLLLETKGRISRANQQYFASRNPVLPDDIPMIVLVNRGSASASEIVAGIIQDYDRGVVVGTPTFGKGLVQTIYDLGSDMGLKITTAKYYIPSGRLIQKNDYKKSPIFITQSQNSDTVYHTISGREVVGGGGISPDIMVESEILTEYVIALRRKEMIYQFARNFRANRPDVSLPVSITDSVLDEFRNFLEKHGFVYESQSRKKISELEETLNEEGFTPDDLALLKPLWVQIKEKEMNEFNKNKEQIKKLLEWEVASLIDGMKARIEASLDDDPVIKKSVELLKGEAFSIPDID